MYSQERIALGWQPLFKSDIWEKLCVVTDCESNLVRGFAYCKKLQCWRFIAARSAHYLQENTS